MAWVAAVAAGGAKAVQAYQASKLKRAEAAELRNAKNRRMAATTRDIAEEERKKAHIHSRAVAIAAASGGGVDDPSMVNLLGDLNAEGEYRVMATLWKGQDEAAGLIYRAEAAEREADDILVAGAFNAVSSAFSAYSGAGGSFGGGGGGGSSSSAGVPA